MLDAAFQTSSAEGTSEFKCPTSKFSQSRTEEGEKNLAFRFENSWRKAQIKVSFYDNDNLFI